MIKSQDLIEGNDLWCNKKLAGNFDVSLHMRLRECISIINVLCLMLKLIKIMNMFSNHNWLVVKARVTIEVICIKFFDKTTRDLHLCTNCYFCDIIIVLIWNPIRSHMLSVFEILTATKVKTCNCQVIISCLENELS